MCKRPSPVDLTGSDSPTLEEPTLLISESQPLRALKAKVSTFNRVKKPIRSLCNGLSTETVQYLNVTSVSSLNSAFCTNCSFQIVFKVTSRVPDSMLILGRSYVFPKIANVNWLVAHQATISSFVKRKTHIKSFLL